MIRPREAIVTFEIRDPAVSHLKSLWWLDIHEVLWSVQSSKYAEGSYCVKVLVHDSLKLNAGLLDAVSSKLRDIIHKQALVPA